MNLIFMNFRILRLCPWNIIPISKYYVKHFQQSWTIRTTYWCVHDGSVEHSALAMLIVLLRKQNFAGVLLE